MARLFSYKKSLVNSQKVLVVLFLYLTCSVMSESSPCPCDRGEYCKDNQCQPCPPGTYQDQRVYREKICKKWTVKSERDHWQLVKNGSDTADQEWACQAGFVEKQFSGGKFSCELMTTPSTTTSWDVSFRNSTTSGSRLDLTAQENTSYSERVDNSVFLFPAVVATVCVLLAIVVSYVFYRKYKSKKNGQKSQSSSQMSFEEQKTKRNNYNYDNNSFSEVKVNTFPFFHHYVKQLEPSLLHKMLRIIPNASKTFNPVSALGFKLNEKNDFPLSVTYCFMEWAEKNPRVDFKQIFLLTLWYVGCRDLATKAFKSELCTVEMEEVGSDTNITRRECSGEEHDSLLQSSQKENKLTLLSLQPDPADPNKLQEILRVPSSDSQVFNLLCYYLAESLGGDKEAFLDRLSLRTNLRQRLDAKNETLQNRETSFVDVMLDTKRSEFFSTCIIEHTINTLKDLNYTELLSDQRFSDILKTFSNLDGSFKHNTCESHGNI